MNQKFNSIPAYSALCVALKLVLSAVSSAAQSLSPTIPAGTGNGGFDYILSLPDTGFADLTSGRYDWTFDGAILPSDPGEAGNSFVWGTDLDVNSIIWRSPAGTALPSPPPSAEWLTAGTLALMLVGWWKLRTLEL